MEVAWVCLPWVYLHAGIYETYVGWWFPRELCSIGGGSGVSLLWVYVHSAIYETYMVQWYSSDLCLIGGWMVSQSSLGICAFCYILNLFGVVVLHRSIVN